MSECPILSHLLRKGGRKTLTSLRCHPERRRCPLWRTTPQSKDPYIHRPIPHCLHLANVGALLNQLRACNPWALAHALRNELFFLTLPLQSNCGSPWKPIPTRRQNATPKNS